jgi:hypothetical protein
VRAEPAYSQRLVVPFDWTLGSYATSDLALRQRWVSPPECISLRLVEGDAGVKCVALALRPRATSESHAKQFLQGVPECIGILGKRQESREYLCDQVPHVTPADRRAILANCRKTVLQTMESVGRMVHQLHLFTNDFI